MTAGWIEIKGARAHNLKGIDVRIPRGQLTVITGVSGSGKSSLAFDTLYEEGRRRYLSLTETEFAIESQASFDSITGLPPAVAARQRQTRQSNPRSTVGTRTKLSHMIAALYANFGERPGQKENLRPLELSMFLRNSPKGMCVKCLGAGGVFVCDEQELFSDMSRALEKIYGEVDTHYTSRIRRFCANNGLAPGQRIDSLSEDEFYKFKYGDGITHKFSGVVNFAVDFYRWSAGKSNWGSRLTCVKRAACPRCEGSGLNAEASRTTLNGVTITRLEETYVSDLLAFMEGYYLNCGGAAWRGGVLVNELITKLKCMDDVGLGHLSLSRPAPTLSGGEIQRMLLASYIIAEMDSIVFIFDEPTIGLHETEKAKLVASVRELVKRGNTVVAVEHDENFMRAADWIVDLGPLAGERGGESIYQGPPGESFYQNERSLTSPYLSGRLKLPRRNVRRTADPARQLLVAGCATHNLRNVDAAFPLGLFVGVAGVSGSGKSSLVADTLVPLLKQKLKARLVTGEGAEKAQAASSDEPAEGEPYPAASSDGKALGIAGYESIRKCAVIDQKPIGRSRTSCPATYVGIFDRVRALYSRESGLDPGVFSLNSKGGCPRCKGDGELRYHVGMGSFMHIECEDCAGTGFTAEATSFKLEGKSISDVLAMSVSTALDFFRGKDKAITKMLETLDRVGMGYIGLGQKTPTISGGEAQRIKLASELGKSQPTRGNVYILDEPTTGLSFSDTGRLVLLLQDLVDGGATVIVTEHDPYVLSCCDHIIELGPGGGKEGGEIVARGTPAELASNKNSTIGMFLR